MKGAGDQVNILISAQSAEGAKFFQQHHNELMQSLNQAGVQVADFKLDTSSQSNNNSQQDSSRQFNGQEKQHAQHEQNRRDNESQKRHELWAHLNKEKELA